MKVLNKQRRNAIKRSIRESAIRKQRIRRKLHEAVAEEPEVFMNTWANYNQYGADEGITPTGWMSLEDAIDYFDKYSEYEPFINDVDGIPDSLGIGEGSSVKDLQKLLDLINDGEDLSIIGAIAEVSEEGLDVAVEIYEDGSYDWYEDVSNDEDIAYSYIDSLGGVERLDRETLEQYFDYEAFGRDMVLNNSIRYVDGGAIKIF